MLRSISLLVFMSIIRGSILIWLIFPTPPMICLRLFMKMLILLVCILGGLAGYLVSDVSLYFNNNSLSLNKIVSFFIGI